MLAHLLAPYADPGRGQRARAVNVPPPVAAAALRLLVVDQVRGRCNGVQPSMRWLVEQTTPQDVVDRVDHGIGVGHVDVVEPVVHHPVRARA